MKGDGAMTDDYHEGRPVIRTSTDKKSVIVLCPYGHLHTSLPMKEWAGSWLEARASDQSWTVRCYGALPKPKEPNHVPDQRRHQD